MRNQLSFHITAISLSLVVMVAMTNPAWGQTKQDDWPAGVAARDELSKDRSYNYDFTNISVGTLQSWLGRIGVELPVKLDGNLAGWVWVQRSKDGWFDFANYRVEGEIRTPELTIDNWTVSEAEVRFGLANGNWYVGKLSGAVLSPDDQSPIGNAIANAKILISTKSLVELNAKVDQIDLSSLLKAFGIDVGIKNAGGSVNFSGEVPIASISDLSTWNATTVLKLDDVCVPWIESPSNALVGVKLANGAWELADGRLTIAGQQLTLAAAGRLAAELPFEVSLSGRDIQAGPLLRQLKYPELAAQIAGAIRLDATARGNQSTGVEKVTAVVQSDTLILRSQPVKRLQVRAGYSPTGIQLDIDPIEMAGGVVKGSATWSDIHRLVQGIPSTAGLEISHLNLEDLGWLDLPALIRGRVSGNVEYATQTRNNADDWSSSGQVQVDGLEVAGTKFGGTRIDWRKSLIADELTGQVSVSQGKGILQSNISTKFRDVPNSRFRATELVNYRAEGQLREYDFFLSRGNLTSNLIPVRATGSFDVTGSPSNWFQRGTAQLSNSMAMWGDRLLQLEKADISFSPDEIRLERFRIIDPNGRIAGAASLRRNSVGEHLLHLRVVGVELKPYLEPFVPPSLRSLNGTIDFELELRKDANTASLAENWNGQWKGNLSDVSYQGQPIGSLELTGDVVDQILSADVNGRLLGGIANASLKFPMSILNDKADAIHQPAKLQVQLDKLNAKQLVGLFDKTFASDVSGMATVQFTAEGRTPDDLVISTQIELPLLIKRQEILARDFRAQIRYTGNNLLVDRISGGLAGGRIDARGQLKFDDDESSTKLTGGKINFAARRLNASSLVAMLNPAYAKYYAGELSYDGTADFYRGIQLRGIAAVGKASLLGLPIQNVRGDVQTEFGSDFEFRRLICNDLHGTVVGGKFSGKLAADGGSQLSLKTSGQIANGKLEQLSRALGFSKIVGSGSFDGRFDLRSREIESLKDLQGGLQMDFKNGDVESFPVISNLSRLVPLAQFASTNIDSGRLDARLNQGQLRISNLVLTSKAFWLIASGSASLDATKLDIDAVLQTGGGVQQRATQDATQLLLVGSAPQVVAITELNELVRNRSIFVHVGGRPSQPVIQANTGQTAARAFLQSYGRSTLGAPQLINK